MYINKKSHPILNYRDVAMIFIFNEGAKVTNIEEANLSQHLQQSTKAKILNMKFYIYGCEKSAELL